MKSQFDYDRSFEPPAPILPVGIAPPGGGEMVMVPMLVDTGADCTLLPPSIVRRLQLPLVDAITVSGVGGSRVRSTVHAARVSIGGRQILARVVALPDEAILGRDVLRALILELDGPAARVSVNPGKPPRRRRARRSSR